MHTNAFELQYLKKKRKKKHCYQYKDLNHRCKGYTLGKTPVSLPITTGYLLPPTRDRFRQKKKRQSNYKWGMTGQNCTSLHWIPYILDRRQLTLAHQATFQIGRQFRFPWQPAENGWLEIGLYGRAISALDLGQRHPKANMHKSAKRYQAESTWLGKHHVYCTRVTFVPVTHLSIVDFFWWPALSPSCTWGAQEDWPRSQFCHAQPTGAIAALDLRRRHSKPNMDKNIPKWLQAEST